MKTNFEVECQFPVSSKIIYDAWLSSQEHEKMTGGGAECSDSVGGSFSAWDGYISGQNLSLEPGKKIVQTWRTTEFSQEDEDSTITIELIDSDSGCMLKLIHENIPEGQPDYKQGWVDHYFNPMKEYFQS